MKTTVIVLAFLLAFSPLAGGALSQIALAADDFIESPVIPITPGSGETQGLSYAFDDEKMTATVIDYVGEEEAIVIPATVADGEKVYTVTAVGSAAFSAITSATAVVLPATVKTIEVYAFDACHALTDVWFEGDKAAFVQINIADGNDALINADIHYDACLASEGPDFFHAYDDHQDAECNNCGKMRAVAEDFLAGDVNGSEGVDIDDAIYLLFHINFSDAYPVNQTVDFDASGAVDLYDVFYLLYHINFPDRYPLA